MKYFKDIASSSEQQKRLLLLTGMVGLVASDIIPTPADGIYFYLERGLRDGYINGTITPKQYWAWKTIYYYGLNPLWWLAVLGVTASIHADVKHKLYIASGIIGAGAVAGVIMNNIKKDIEQQSKESIVVVPKK